MDTKKPDRHRGHGHHRPAGPRRLGARVRGLAGGHEPAKPPSTRDSSVPRSTRLPRVQPEWVVVYRFDSIAHVQAWINSAHAAGSTGRGSAVLRRARHPAGSRRRRAAHGSPRHRRRDPPREPGERRGLPRLAGPTARGGEQVRRASAAPSCSARSRVFRTSGPRSTATRTPTDLDTWLISKERQDLLAEGEKFSDFRSSTIDNSFGSWFAFDEHGNQVPPPSETKTSIAVWVGLYPTVVLLTPRAVAAADAAVAQPARRKPAVQLHHDLRDDALLREPAAETLAPTAAGHAAGSERTGEASASSPPSPRSGWSVFYLVTTQL